MLVECIGEDSLWDSQSFYAAAIAEHERRGVPAVGYSVDRRTQELTTDVYNDKNIKALMCFICAQVKPATSGARSLISMRSATWLLGDPIHRGPDAVRARAAAVLVSCLPL